MASHRRTRETHPAYSAMMLVVVLLMAAGCRSTSGVSRMPGMGWMAGSQRSDGQNQGELDPTAAFPPPSSVSVPQTLADAERPSTIPSHQTAIYEPPLNSSQNVAPVTYPSTEYAPIAANHPGMRPEPNPMSGTGAMNSSTHGADYVQNGTYSAGNATPTASAATTWGSAGVPGNPERAITPSSSDSIYGSDGRNSTAIASSGGTPSIASDSMYNGQVTPATRQPHQVPETTWAQPSVTSVPPGAGLQAQMSSGTEPVMSPGFVAPASFQGPSPGGTSTYESVPKTADRAASSGAGQPWLPGSTAAYSLR